MRTAVFLLALIGGGCSSREIPANIYCLRSHEYLPACGVDGLTYANNSEAVCAGVAVAHEGACADAATDGQAEGDVSAEVSDAAFAAAADTAPVDAAR